MMKIGCIFPIVYLIASGTSPRSSCPDKAHQAISAAFVCPPRLQRHRKVNESRTTEQSQERISTFQVFEESVLERIKESQLNDICLSSSAQDVANTLVKMSYIQEAFQQANYEGRKHLTTLMNDAGGYLIVELDNESQREILSNMWECIHDIDFSETLDSSDNHAPVFRQQELTRNDGENQRSQSGYRHIETSIRRRDNTLSLAGSDDRGSLETILGTNGTAVAARAFDLLLNIATTVVYMSVCDSQAFDGTSSSLVGALSRITDLGAILNDSFSHENTPWSCTIHRLCRYARSESSDKPFENIRSHADWTLATLVPVSQIVGL